MGLFPKAKENEMIELAVGLFIGFWVILIGFWLLLNLVAALARCAEYVINLPKNIVEFFKEIRRERAEMKRLGITEYGNYVEYVKAQERKKSEEEYEKLRGWHGPGLMNMHDC